jgi:predicted Zn-dependent protease
MFLARSLFDEVKRNLLLNNDDVARIIEGLGGPVVLLAQMDYSRQNESEADMLGFYEMLRAGWNPNGLLTFFTRLEHTEKGRTSLDIMLSDHPAPADRAEAIRRELASVKVTAPLVEQTVQFRTMKSTLKSLPPAPKPEKR